MGKNFKSGRSGGINKKAGEPNFVEKVEKRGAYYLFIPIFC